ncbi:MAG: ABC transporter ATP-binding protein [Streptosporangiaceae bacterium]
MTEAGGEALLEVRDLTVHHGQLQALEHISLRVFPGEVYAIIGANGAGKSTLLRTIAGLHTPTEGSVLLDGKDVTRLRPEKRAIAGIGMVPEGRRLFGSLSVEENLQVGASYARKGPWNIEQVYDLFGWMKDRRSQKTSQLSGGEQQSVAIGRALVANPRVLLLDELSLGLAPVVVQRIYEMLPQILATGLTVLLVEQDVSQALRVASHIQCLLEGRTTLEGRPSDVTPEQVEAAYFGLGSSAAAPVGHGGPVGYGGPGGSEGSEGSVRPEGGARPPVGGPGGYGGAGSPPVSGVGLGGVAPSEETESLWSGSTTSSRAS